MPISGVSTDRQSGCTRTRGELNAVPMDISERIDAVYQAHQQVLNLYRLTGDLPTHRPDLLDASLSHLETVLEELRLAYEELQQQNQALVDYRQQLEAERHRYQELFNLAPDGYLVTNATGIIQEANVALATMLNVSQADLIGKPLLLFFRKSRSPPHPHYPGPVESAPACAHPDLGNPTVPASWRSDRGGRDADL